MNAWRWPVLLLVLVLTAAAAIVDWPGAEPDAAPRAAVERTPGTDAQSRRDVPLPAEVLALAGQAVPRFAQQGPDLFPKVDFSRKPVPHKPAPPPPPVAPPLPFRYLGKAIEGSSISVFLADGARTHVAKVGSVLGNYRVEEISNSAATLVFLPLNEKQQILFGSSN